MKPNYSLAGKVVLIFLCIVFIGAAAQGGSPSGYLRSNHHFAPGGLIVERSPNFGWNIALHLQIDGRTVADIVNNRRYESLVPAGRHVLTVSAVPAVSIYAYRQPTSITVNIQPGAEYRFTAMWDSGLVYLQPAGVSVTPGAFWQNHGDGYPGSRYAGSRY